MRPAVDALFRTDLDLKRSAGDPRVLLERLVVELCAGKRGVGAALVGSRAGLRRSASTAVAQAVSPTDAARRYDRAASRVVSRDL